MLRNIFALIMVSFVLLTLNNQAWGSPSVYLNETNALSNIANKVNAKIIGDHQNPKMVYVLPPTLGTIEMKNFKSTANMAFCDELSELVKYSRTRTSELANLAVARQKILASKIEVESGKNNVDAELGKMRSENPVIVEYEKLSTNAKVNADAIKKIETENADLIAKYKALQKQATQLQSTFDDLDKKFTTLEQRIADIKKVFDGLYEKFAKREGGFANFTYDSGWDNQVKTLGEDNPDYKFEKVYTKDVTMYAKFIGASDKAAYEASLPAILDYVVNGESHNPSGDKPSTLAAMPSVMSAHVRLSLAGACALINPELFNIKKSEAGVPVFGLTATYQFPSVFSANVKITYNRHTIYNAVKKEGKATGVFTTRQMRDMVDKKDAFGDMKIEWKDNGDGEISEADKMKIIAELRLEVLKEVLELTAVPNADKTLGNIVEGDTGDFWKPKKQPSMWDWGSGGGPSSGGGFGDSLGDCGGFSKIYCILGGFILKGLNAIFGGDKADTKFYSTVSAVVTREFNTNTARLRSGVTVFTNDTTSGKK